MQTKKEDTWSFKWETMLQYLGHIIFAEGIAVDPEKIKSIMEWSVPKDVAYICSFMGVTGYYPRFIVGVFQNILPYHIITKKNGPSLTGHKSVKTVLTS
jgi:hypothetical protein